MFSTVEPPISDCPKCEVWLVAYGKWLLMRALILMAQNFSLLEYGNCRDLIHPPLPMQCFIPVTVNLKRNILFLPLWNFSVLYYIARNTIIIIYFSLHDLSSSRLQEVKNKGNFQTVSFKSGCVTYERWSFTRGFKCSDLTWKLLVFWKTGPWGVVVT